MKKLLDISLGGFIDAMVWYETLSDEDKAKVDIIGVWKHRPAVC